MGHNKEYHEMTWTTTKRLFINLTKIWVRLVVIYIMRLMKNQ